MHPRLLAPFVAGLLLAGSAQAEPALRLATAPGGDLLVSWEPEAVEPLAWNVYRGDLGFVGFGTHRGSPLGRCALAGSAREVLLPGQADLRANFYYLLTSFDSTRSEQGPGLDSLGAPRAHDEPCRFQSSCPSGGPPVDPAADWSALHGTVPAELLGAASFTALNMDGATRGPGDLFGRATALWFYPAAGTGG